MIPTMPVHWLRVTRTCNNACSFCSESAALDGVPVPLAELEQVLDGIEAQLGEKRDNVEIRLSGGEPTLSPHLPAVIASVARRGLLPVLVSNGRALAKPGRIAHLVEHGLAGVRLSLHGATPTVHDALVGVAGAFRQTLTALAHAASTGARRTVCFVLTRENVGELPALFELMKRASCGELELRDVLPTADRERFMALRLSDEAALQALSDAHRRAERANVHLTIIGFERTATNTRGSAFAAEANWPGAPTARIPPKTPERVVVLGQPRDPVMNRSTIARVVEAVAARGIPNVRRAPHAPLLLEPGDLVLCTGYAEAADLFAREPAAAEFDVRILDFHMLGDFGAFRARWVPDARQQASTPWWPSERLAVISCFPGYAPLYAWYGVPPEALTVHPYTVDPADFGPHPETHDAYVFSGGNHLRDMETLATASALRRGTNPLPIHVYHGGPPGSPAAGVVYRGTVEFGSFYRAVATSRFVVLPLSRDPSCAAGITVAAMALAAGRAVVASATPAMRDHLDDGVNAILVEPEDPHALARAIEQLERDHELRARLEQGARQAAAMATATTLVDVLLGRR